MAVGQAFRVKRVTLVAGVLTAVYPPVTARAVSIGNASSADLQVHTHDDESEYVVVGAGWEREIVLIQHRFVPDQIAFWLKNASGGTAVLIWF